MATEPEVLEFYRHARGLTDPGPHRELLAPLPRNVDDLAAIVQGLVLNFHTAGLYGVTHSEERRQDAHKRSLRAILARILELDDRPLDEPREPADRFAGTCRDFTLLLCGILRLQGVPARARCGFAAYFTPGYFEDHWVCEHWCSTRQRWLRTDAQLDRVQREALKIEFDPVDVPKDQFLIAGRAWELCRAKDEDPARFGILDMRGLWFIRGNVVRDLAALNRVELLPWDGWGLMLRLGQSDECPANDLALLDEAAGLTQGGVEAFDSMRKLYDSEPSLYVPPSVTNFQTGSQESIEPA